MRRCSAVRQEYPRIRNRAEAEVAGMWGWTWDQSGNRTAVRGLINPFWIAVNMLLRAMGLYGDPSTGSNPAGGSGPASSAQLATLRPSR
jgi:hypothetical protein